MPQIRVERNNIVVGAINSFEVGEFGIGATTGECTIRREIEFFDVEIEQAFGTIRKSPVTDKRFLTVSTAEAHLQSLLNAWNDDQTEGGSPFNRRDAIYNEISDDGEDFGVEEDEPYGLTNDGNRLIMAGSGNTSTRIYSVNSIGQAEEIVGSATGADLGITGMTAVTGLTMHNGTLYGVGYHPPGSSDKLYSISLSGNSAGTATLIGTRLQNGGTTRVRGLASDGEDMFSIVVLSDAGSTAVGLIKMDKTSGGAFDGTTTDVGNHANHFGSGVSGNVDALDSVSDYGGLAYGNGTLYMTAKAIGTGSGFYLYTVNKTNGTVNHVTSNPLRSENQNFGISTTTWGTVDPGDMTFFDGALWMVDTAQDALIRVDEKTGKGVPVGDISTYYMNNMPSGANVSEIEKEVKIIVPGPNDRFRAYKFNRCVSTTPAEHTYQKNGLTMIPYEFEVLVDPSSASGHYGIIKDFPTFEEADEF